MTPKKRKCVVEEEGVADGAQVPDAGDRGAAVD